MDHDMTDDSTPRIQDDDTIPRLLRLAGPRPLVDPERRARVHRAVRDTWRAEIRRQRGTRKLVLAAATIAAAAAIVVLVILLPPRDAVRPSATPAAVARVEVADGSISIIGPDGRRRTAAAQAMVVDGDRIETPEGTHAALRLRMGASLRIDEQSSVALGRADVRLLRGALYIDSDPRLPSRAMPIQTPYGTVREIGTQFEVRLVQKGLSVRVREGLVTLNRAGAITHVERGQKIVVNGQGIVERASISTDDASWSWVESIAPPFDLDGRTLRAFLDWSSRETGLSIQFRGEASKIDPNSIVLHGTTRGMTPRQAIDAVLPTCGLESSTADGRITITREVR